MDRILRKCPCVKPPEIEVHVLDYSHCNLDYVPAEVFNFERTLEELFVDANQIRDLPRELFYCHGLRKLNLSDNELTSIPPAISSLSNLEELDISKNGIIDFPDDLKCCKYISSIEASVNPLGKLPDSFTQLLNLTELYLNDTFLDFLPGSFGRLTKLKILEVRENHLKTLPKSVSKLILLERLDIGNNHFSELPEVVGSLPSLVELWCDCNQIKFVPKVIGELKELMFLDASKNRIESLPDEIEGCLSLADLHLSTNLLQQLPDGIGRLSNLTTLKVDDNRLTSLPFTIGGLVSLSELNISANDLEELPPSIGFLRHLRTLYADENFLFDIPPEVGSCNGITVLSLRSNNLMYIPDELGRIPHLRVLNLSDNKIKFLPYSLMRLKELTALWLAENQTMPLIRLQQDIDIDTGQRMLTCYLLPQQHTDDREDMYSDADSFHPSLWEEERQQRQRIHFENIQEEEGNLQRTPTPYPKEMKHRIQHMRNLALKQLGCPGITSPEKIDPTVNQSAVGSISTTEGTSAGAKPTSPLLQERHHLLKADKEKNLKDKAKIHHSQPKINDGSFTKDLSSNGHTLLYASNSQKLTSSGSKIMSPSQSPKKEDDEGGFLIRSKQRNGSHSSSLEQSYSGSSPVSRGNSNSLRRHSGPQSSNSQIGQQLHQSSYSYTDFSRGIKEKNSTGTWTQHNRFQVTPESHYRCLAGRRVGGYESETGGYRSDIEHHRGRQAQYRLPGRDGYSSDWEASQGHHRKEGYASDAELGRSRYRLYRPVPIQPVSSSSSVKKAWNNRQHESTKQGSSSYSNVPFSSKMTIRNDEMYEQKSCDSKAKKIMHRSPSATPNKYSKTTGEQPFVGMKNNIERKLSNASQNSTSTDRSQQIRHSGTSQHTLSHSPATSPCKSSQSNNVSVDSNTNPNSSERFNTDASCPGAGDADVSRHQSESTNPTDDELWKAQLYKASVKLQKSPANRTRKLQSWCSYPQLPSRPPHMYGWEQPYSSDPISPASPSLDLIRGGDTSALNVSQSSASRTSYPALPRPLSYPHSGLPSSVGPANTNSASPSMQSRHASVPSPSFSGQNTVNPAAQSPRVHMVDMSNSLPHGSLHSQIYHVSQGSPVQPFNVGTSPRKNPSHSGSSNVGQGLRYSKYDQDVAVFKEVEPASKVSSCTDSGYGTQVYDRPPLGASPLLDTSKSLQHSVLGHDMRLPCSRESTPGHCSESGFASPSHPEKSPACPASSPHKQNTFRIEVSKNPGLGFSISGGIGSSGNPFRPIDMGIFITKVQEDGPAGKMLLPGDKLLEVNGVDFKEVEHNKAVNILRNSGNSVSLVVERL